MASTSGKKLRITLAAILFLFAAALYGQSAPAGTAVSVGTEIQNLERLAARQGVGASEKHNALVRLARLRQLSGDIEGASRNWLEAAAAEPGKTDESALLASAFCLAAMGEWSRANAALRPILQANRPGQTLLRARFLDACVKAWDGDASEGGAASLLIALADNGEFAEMKSGIYYALWKTASAGLAGTASADVWMRRLITEFPQSVEARIAASETGSQTGATDAVAPANAVIVAKQSPLWLLMAGRGGAPVQAVTQQIQAASSAASPSAAASAPVGRAPIPAGGAAQTQTGRLQTGLFSRQENAQAHFERLKTAGFAALISQRIVNGISYWAVTVSAGDDANRRIRELKNAGFESFPVSP